MKRQIVVGIEAGEKNCETCDWYTPEYTDYRCMLYPKRKLRFSQKDDSPRRCAECLKREIKPGKGKAVLLDYINNSL